MAHRGGVVVAAVAARVAMAGAHLDSVPGGPGMNDDGSGIAALLDVAARLRDRVPAGGRVRLGFWAAEELGLYGSRRYVASLDAADRDAIAGYVNLDMVGTRGGRMEVYEGDAGIRAGCRTPRRPPLRPCASSRRPERQVVHGHRLVAA